jgi:hypothetical protein
VGQLVASVAEHPQRLEFAVRDDLAKTAGADRDDRDGVRVDGVGLAVVAGVEQPEHPSSSSAPTGPASPQRSHVARLVPLVRRRRQG